MTAENGRPSWWQDCASLKEGLGLPEYEPPQFSDGVFTHEVTSRLEEECRCSIRFAAKNPRYPDDWEVWVDGSSVMTVGRRRNRDGNTVYELTSDEFERRLRSHLDE